MTYRQLLILIVTTFTVFLSFSCQSSEDNKDEMSTDDASSNSTSPINNSIFEDNTPSDRDTAPHDTTETGGSDRDTASPDTWELLRDTAPPDTGELPKDTDTTYCTTTKNICDSVDDEECGNTCGFMGSPGNCEISGLLSCVRLATDICDSDFATSDPDMGVCIPKADRPCETHSDCCFPMPNNHIGWCSSYLWKCLPDREGTNLCTITCNCD